MSKCSVYENCWVNGSHTSDFCIGILKKALLHCESHDGLVVLCSLVVERNALQAVELINC